MVKSDGQRRRELDEHMEGQKKHCSNCAEYIGFELWQENEGFCNDCRPATTELQNYKQAQDKFWDWQEQLDGLEEAYCSACNRSLNIKDEGWNFEDFEKKVYQCSCGQIYQIEISRPIVIDIMREEEKKPPQWQA